MATTQVRRGRTLDFTPQITTGDVATVNDATPQNDLGVIYLTVDASNNLVKYKYVKMGATVPATGTAGAPVYYTDATRSIVTNTVTEAFSHATSSFGANGSFAGLLLNASVTNGYYIWILVEGYFASVTAPASVVKGDVLVCSNTAASAPTDNTLVRVAAGVAPVAGAMEPGHIRALGTVSAGLAPGYVFCK